MPQGRHPKPPELRQNKTKKAGRSRLTNPPPERVPELPQIKDVAWHRQTRDWWRTVWRSPMAGEYFEADIPGLERLALLINQFYLSLDPKLMPEIRLQESRFGLSPIDRARLQWEVAKGDEAERKRKPATQPKRESSGDPRDVLRVVS